MMYASVLAREELRILEELISRFDSLTEAQMSVVGVTPEWSAKDLLAHLAYWERAAAEQVREFEAGRPAAQAASCGTASRLGYKSWQDIVNEKESPRERRSVQRNRSIRAGRK